MYLYSALKYKETIIVDIVVFFMIYPFEGFIYERAKNLDPTFVFTDSLKGGLNQITFPFLFLFNFLILSEGLI